MNGMPEDAVEVIEDNEDTVEAEVEDVLTADDELVDDDAEEPMTIKPTKKSKTKLKLVKSGPGAKKASAKTKSAQPTKAAKPSKPAKSKKAAVKKPKVTKSKRPSAPPSKKSAKSAKAARVTKAVKQAARSAVAPAKVIKKAVRPARTKTAKVACVHVRIAAAKDSDTQCGGSHSPIWNRKGDRPLTSVGPQQASKGTCGRCIRVCNAKGLL